jgi:U32 family peptidase
MQERSCISQTFFMKPLGKITHYYDKVGVAIVELQDELKIGDRIRIEHKDQSFDQKVTSMQKEYQQMEKAQKGDSVGIKVDQKAKEGSLVLLLEEGE